MNRSMRSTMSLAMCPSPVVPFGLSERTSSFFKRRSFLISLAHVVFVGNGVIFLRVARCAPARFVNGVIFAFQRDDVGGGLFIRRSIVEQRFINQREQPAFQVFFRGHKRLVLHILEVGKRQLVEGGHAAFLSNSTLEKCCLLPSAPHRHSMRLTF